MPIGQNMNSRQKNLLNLIVSSYTKTAIPVGSKLIAQQANLDLSPATIRNEMAELEKEGYIFQPYTSAGRIPTEKGYQFYIDNFLATEETLPKKYQESLLGVKKVFNKYQPELVKELAKKVVDLAQGAVFVGFSADNVYYTGLSSLFSQPEFVQHSLVCDLSRVIDHLDKTINEIFSDINGVEILIGSQNPFARDCSAVLGKYEVQGQSGLFGILGPTRMDYQNNFNLVKHVKNLINNF